MQYILYENDTYKYIGSKIPDIELTFSLKQFSSIRYTNKDIEFNKSTFMDVGNILLTSEDKLQMENELLSMLNPILEEYREKGLFYAPFLYVMLIKHL